MSEEVLMLEFLPDGDVAVDEDPLGDADRLTLEIPDDTLVALVAKSRPPGARRASDPVISERYRDRISSASAFTLSKRWAEDHSSSE